MICVSYLFAGSEVSFMAKSPSKSAGELLCAPSLTVTYDLSSVQAVVLLLALRYVSFCSGVLVVHAISCFIVLKKYSKTHV
jgi:hypothetical protein